MKKIFELIKREEQRDGTEILKGYYGVELKNEKYKKISSIIKNKVYYTNVYNQVFNGLTEEQIDFLENTFNNLHHCNIKFPYFYRNFLRHCNGFELYSGAIIIYGNDLINNRLPGARVSDPLDFGPSSLLFPGEAFYDKSLQERWLFIGRYNYDGTNIVWDYKLNKVILMEPLPQIKNKKEWMSVTEKMIEDKIIHVYDDFDCFIDSEVDRIEKVFNDSMDDDYKTFLKKCLPVYCKNHLD